DREIELGHGNSSPNATYETVMPCSAVVTVPLSSTQAKAKVPLSATFTVNSKYGLAEIAGSRSARNTSWPLKVQTNELMISRGIGFFFFFFFVAGRPPRGTTASVCLCVGP